MENSQSSKQTEETKQDLQKSKSDPTTENEKQVVKENTVLPTASLEMTAMGGTLEEDIKQSVPAESEQEEENIKDTLNKRITELEAKLKQTDDYYDKLNQEVIAAKALYEREHEECEDVISVAKRNIENHVTKILDLQNKKKMLASKIDEQKDRLMKEEEATLIELKLEEERLTRNVVILQTKLLINEGIKFERDKLLSKLQYLENDLTEKERYYQEQLQKARGQIQEKYRRLYKIVNEHKESIVENVKNLTLRQQIAALKHGQEQVVNIQMKYKNTSRNLLQMMDKNKELNKKKHNLDVQVSMQRSLIKAANAGTEIAEKNRKSSAEDLTSKEAEYITRTLEELHQKIEAFKSKFHRERDEGSELKSIMEDQKQYLQTIKSQKEKLHLIEQRLIPLSDVAEFIIKRGRVELKDGFEDSTMRSDVFQMFSLIITESEELQKYMSYRRDTLQTPQSDVLSTPSPCEDKPIQNNSGKALPNDIKSMPFTKHLDKVEKKILSELSMLGKYRRKQKKLMEVGVNL